MSDAFTTGIGSIDSLIQGVRVGDNLVLQSHGGVALPAIVERFVAARQGRPLVACTVGRTWPPALASSLTVTDLVGQADDVPMSVGEARRTVAHLDEQAGGEALFVFWTLGAMQDAWGPAESLDFFLWACPRLYRRGSVALWPMDPDLHTPRYLRRLADITQVVVELDPDAAGDMLLASVRKADGRPSDVVGRRVMLDVQTLEPRTQPERDDPSPGERVLIQRTERGLAQSELARLVGISPSALSQLERGTRGVSADTITRIWQALGVPFGPANANPAGYAIARRGAQPTPETANGMTKRRLTADDGPLETWLIAIEPGGTGRGAPFAVKTPEVVTVLRGVIDLDVGGHQETLQEGDTLVVTTSAVAGWSNPGTTAVELHWSLLPS